jgi:hypothetical protein
MAVTVLGVDGNAFDQNSVEVPAGRFLRTYITLKLSGNYVTGGDTLDLTNGGGSAASPTAIPSAQVRGLASVDIRPIAKTTSSLSAVGGAYACIAPGGVVPIPNSALNALKLKLFLVTNSEYSAGAYGADALGDIIIAELTWMR